jgi:hypothetical protein
MTDLWNLILDKKNNTFLIALVTTRRIGNVASVTLTQK